MLAVEHAHREGNGLSCTVHVAAYRHAPADVEHDRQTDRRVARVEIADLPLRPGVEYLKIVAAQVADDPAPAIPDGGRHGDDLDARLEGDRRALMSWRFLRMGLCRCPCDHESPTRGGWPLGESRSIKCSKLLPCL